MATQEAVKHTLFTAWAAGVFEGEGWLYTKVSYPPDRPNRRYTLLAGMTNTDMALLSPFKCEWSGIIREHGRSKLSRKQCWEWRVYGSMAEKFLRDIRPYIVGNKIYKIEEALRVRETFLVWKRTRNARGQFAEAVCQ